MKKQSNLYGVLVKEDTSQLGQLIASVDIHYVDWNPEDKAFQKLVKSIFEKELSVLELISLLKKDTIQNPLLIKKLIKKTTVALPTSDKWPALLITLIPKEDEISSVFDEITTSTNVDEIVKVLKEKFDDKIANTWKELVTTAPDKGLRNLVFLGAFKHAHDSYEEKYPSKTSSVHELRKLIAELRKKSDLYGFRINKDDSQLGQLIAAVDEQYMDWDFTDKKFQDLVKRVFKQNLTKAELVNELKKDKAQNPELIEHLTELIDVHELEKVQKILPQLLQKLSIFENDLKDVIERFAPRHKGEIGKILGYVSRELGSDTAVLWDKAIAVSEPLPSIQKQILSGEISSARDLLKGLNK